MQNIRNFDLKVKEHGALANCLGLNPNKKTFCIKQRHTQFLKKMINLKQRGKEERTVYINFGSRIKNYRYFRNISGYPCRGQRTHTNAKTKKKNKLKSIL